MQISDMFSSNKTETLRIHSFNTKQLSEFNKDICFEKLINRFARRREREKAKIIETIQNMTTIVSYKHCD